jgi:hypothetical protein
MAEKLYAIPVNDAFASDCECPLCALWDRLESDAVRYTMGASYMDDGDRAATDKSGFCTKHMEMLWYEENRLGLALVASTHMKKVLSDVKGIANKKRGKAGLFKKPDEDPVSGYLSRLSRTCYVCERIQKRFQRYIQTIYYLWKKEESFRNTYQSCKGFCNEHYRVLLEGAREGLPGKRFEEFVQVTNRLYIENMERVLGDLEWFINKFDYRYEKEPWKNSKDALPRALVKLNGVICGEKEKKKKNR